MLGVLPGIAAPTVAPATNGKLRGKGAAGAHGVEPVVTGPKKAATGKTGKATSTKGGGQEDPAARTASPKTAVRKAAAKKGATTKVATKGPTPIRGHAKKAGPAPTSVPARAQMVASMRSRATLAQDAVSSSTTIRLRTSPATRPSSTQARWAASMRNIVEQGQTSGSRERIVLSGVSSSSRFTKWISVPTPMTEPEGRRPPPG